MAILITLPAQPLRNYTSNEEELRAIAEAICRTFPNHPQLYGGRVDKFALRENGFRYIIIPCNENELRVQFLENSSEQETRHQIHNLRKEAGDISIYFEKRESELWTSNS